MDNEDLGPAVREIGRLFSAGGIAGLSDEQLRERFVRGGDSTAFEALVARHGPMVFAVCRGVLGNEADTDDAFQATFLVLVRKARSLSVDNTLAGWLYRVAYRIATRAKRVAARRRLWERKRSAGMGEAAEGQRALEHDVAPLLYSELDRLPGKYRDPVLLCYLEGMTYEEAAARLRWPTGTVASRLTRARELLRTRLTRRGVTLSAAALAAELARPATAAMQPAWARRAVDTASAVAQGQALPTSGVSAGARSLAEWAVRTPLGAKLLVAPFILVAVFSATALPPLLVRWQRAQPAPAIGRDDQVNREVLTFAIPATDFVAGIAGPVSAARASNEVWQPVSAVAYSPDGRLLAVAVEGTRVIVREVATRKVAAILKGHSGAVTGVAFSPDGEAIATCSRDGTVRLWIARDGSERAVLHGHTGAVLAVAYAPDGRTLASAGEDPSVRLWDPIRGTALGELSGHASPITTLAYAPDGRTLASAGADGAIRLWDVAARSPRTVLGGHSGAVRALAFSRDGTMLASGGDDRTVRLWDVAGATEVHTFAGHQDAVTCLAFDPRGRALASGSADACLRLWDLRTHSPTFTFRGPNPFGLDNVNGHADAVTALAFAPSGRQLASGGRDRAIKLWNTFDNVIAAQSTISAHRGNAWFATFAPDGTMLLTGGDDGLVKLWDVESARLLAVLDGHRASVVRGLFSPDGMTALTSSADGTVRFWDLPSGQPAGTLTIEGQVENNAPVPPLLDRKPGFASALSHDGRLLATSGSDRAIRLWDVATRRPLRVLAQSVALSNGLAFSPDGRWLASGLGHPADPASVDHAVQVWDVATGKRVAALKGHRSAIWEVPFSPDGRLLASPCSDGLTKLWDTNTWSDVGTLTSTGSWVQSAAFAPDSKSLLVGHGNGTVTWWDAATHQPRARLVGHNTAVRGVSFSRRGDWIASASGDGTVRLWRSDRPARGTE
jgi:RNA polymerase sigma factor (sigma-70 family)